MCSWPMWIKVIQENSPPKRWVVERSFAWSARFPRLVRNYERLTTSLAGIRRLAFATLMLNFLFGKVHNTL